MATLVLRSTKGSPLTSTELDNNFNNLNTAKYESGGALGTPLTGTLTNCTGYTWANLSGTLNRLNLGSVAGQGQRSMFGQATLDLTGLLATTYYPVTIPLLQTRTTTLRIEVGLNSGSVPSWSTHPQGFAVFIEWTVNGSGYGTWNVLRTIRGWTEQWVTPGISVVGGITQMTNSSTEVIYLRGGARYYFSADADVTPTVQSASYTIISQTVAPSLTVINVPTDQGSANIGAGSLSLSGALTLNGNTILGNASTDTLNVGNGDLVKDASGRLGIGTISPAQKLDVSSNSTALIPFRAFNSNNNVDTNPTVTQSVARFERGGKDGISYSSVADFGISRYEVSGTTARTQMDIRLSHGDVATPEVTVMSMRSNGNVGIGASSPAQKLEVQDGNIQVRNAQTATIGTILPNGLTFRATNQNTQDRGTIATIKPYLGTVSDNDFGLAFQTQATTAAGVTTKALLLANGNLGLGTTAPNTKLELRTDTNTAGSESNILIQNRGTLTLTNPYYVGGIFGGAYRDIRDPAYIAGIDFYRDSGAGGLSSNGSMRFYTMNDGDTLAGLRTNEKMRLDSSGNLGIGTTNPTYKLQVNGTGYIEGSVNLGGGGGSSKLNIMNTNAPIQMVNATNTNQANIDFADAQTLTLKTYHASGSNLAFATAPSGGANTERMRITAAGGVGIGTNSPLDNGLTVNNTNITSIKNFGNQAWNFAARALGTAQGQLGGYSFWSTFMGTADDGNRRSADIWSGFNGGSWGTQYLAFGVGSSTANDAGDMTPERMRIAASGNIGIGVTSPTAVLHLKAGTATAGTAPFKFTNGTNLTTPEAGGVEYDGAVKYFTNDVRSGRGFTPTTQIFRLTANGTAISGTANFFGINSAIRLLANAEYEIEAYCYFLKTTAGTVTVTPTLTVAPANLNGTVQYGALAGGAASGASNQINLIGSTGTATAFGTSGSLTTAVNHLFIVKLIVEAGATDSDLRLNFTSVTGTVTPIRGSYYKTTRLPASNTGIFAA